MKSTKLLNQIGKGYSEWVPVEILIHNNILRWSNNGNGRHGIYFGDTRFKWEAKRHKNKVVYLRTNGFNDDELKRKSRPIASWIKKICYTRCCASCGKKSDLVVDHKNDLYNDPRVLDIKTQRLDDFQTLCRRCNLIKRQVCIDTIKQNKRQGAGEFNNSIDFIEGDET